MKYITVTFFCHNSCCLPYIKPLASSANSASVYKSHSFSDISISRLRYGGIFNNYFIANFPESVPVIFLNRSIFGEDMDTGMVSPFLTYSVHVEHAVANI